MEDDNERIAGFKRSSDRAPTPAAVVRSKSLRRRSSSALYDDAKIAGANAEEFAVPASEPSGYGGSLEEKSAIYDALERSGGAPDAGLEAINEYRRRARRWRSYRRRRYQAAARARSYFARANRRKTKKNRVRRATKSKKRPSKRRKVGVKYVFTKPRKKGMRYKLRTKKNTPNGEVITYFY